MSTRFHDLPRFNEMMAPPSWEEAFHGEQIAVTTCVMARLQELMLQGDAPELVPTDVTEDAVKTHFGAETGAGDRRD